MKPISLKQVVIDLKMDLDIYLADAKSTAKADLTAGTSHNLSCNEWALQIADIYKTAYGKKLNLTQLPLD